MKLTTANLVAAMIGASLASVTSADMLVSNLNESAPHLTGNFAGPGQIYASRFVTGGDVSEVFSATASLNNESGWGTATYEAFIYTDNGADPRALVASFDSTPTLADGANEANVSFTSVLGITLDADTSYWFGIRNTTGQHMSWRGTRSDSETSTAGWTIDDDAYHRSTNAGASWYSASDFWQGIVLVYSIEGNPAPAPGALALLGTGGLIVTRR